MRLTFESVDGVKQILLPSVVGLVQSVEGLNRTTNLTLLSVREFFPLDSFQAGTLVFSCLQIQTETSAPLGL